MRRVHIATRAASLAMGMAILAGCAKTNPGSFDQTQPLTSRFGNLLAFNKLTGEPPPEKPEERLECPEIVVLDGTAAHRVYNGPEANDTLRYQYSLGDVARECIHQGGDIAMKVGVQGLVLLGPAGAPGSFTVPVRIAVVKQTDDKPVLSKLYSASVTVPAGQTEGTFTIVTEPLLAPFIQEHTAEDYSIKVGIDAGGAPAATARAARKKRG